MKMKPLIKRRSSETQVDEWKNILHVLFLPLKGTFGVILSLFLSHSHASSSFLTEFWSMFCRVWLEGNAPGRCKSGEGCWHRGKQRMSNENPVSISKRAIALEGGLRSGSLWMLSLSRAGFLTFSPASHVKIAQEQKCVLGEYCLSGRLMGGGRLFQLNV